MPKQVTKLKVFVASPGDVSEERKIVRELIDELNHTIADSKGLILQFVGWEIDSWPAFGEDAQDVINQQIGPYDIFVGIMWKRFGTKTKRADSGTGEEFERAYNSWSKYGRPRIMLYFNNVPFFPSSRKEIEQIDNILKFKKKITEKGALFWEYNGLKEFERFVRMHLTKEIMKWEDYGGPATPSSMPRLPLEFYRVLFKELDMYITEFEQLQRDYDREVKGEQLQFAVDFSEVHNYIYPFSIKSPRATLNQYVFDNLENPLTLMPGAVGEMLIDLERALPSSDVLEQDPLRLYRDVFEFVKNFTSVMNNEEEVIRLYSKAEMQLKKAWGELFNVIVQDEKQTAFYAIKSLIEQGKLSPIEGIRKIHDFPMDIREKTQRVKSQLDFARPGTVRNNQIDTIDFAVTWLLNSQQSGSRKKYLSIYTQSDHLLNVCTSSPQLRWEDDYLVRGANYFKFRTKLQDLFPSNIKERRKFVVKWATKCGRLQAELPNLRELAMEPSNLKQLGLGLLDRYREFDEECRIPLIFSFETAEDAKSQALKRGSNLYDILKDEGEFRGRTGEAYDVLKKFLNELQNKLRLFMPEKVHSMDAKRYMENLANWIDIEAIKEKKK